VRLNGWISCACVHVLPHVYLAACAVSLHKRHPSLLWLVGRALASSGVTRRRMYT
jgi:hypothetical protein